jgi:hypothetical protein
VTYSYYYGTATSPLCPGASLTDGIGAVEWLWDCILDCVTPVETKSWGRVKNLYR